jgi:RHS repeat-associated protein
LSYDAYGAVVGRTGEDLTPITYSGGVQDGAVGLQYFVHRYYDSSTGQFMSVDPLVLSTGAAYSYAGGDPVDGIDPEGLEDNDVSGVVCANYGCGAVSKEHGAGGGMGSPGGNVQWGPVSLDIGPQDEIVSWDAIQYQDGSFEASFKIFGNGVELQDGHILPCFGAPVPGAGSISICIPRPTGPPAAYHPASVIPQQLVDGSLHDSRTGQILTGLSTAAPSTQSPATAPAYSPPASTVSQSSYSAGPYVQPSAPAATQHLQPAAGHVQGGSVNIQGSGSSGGHITIQSGYHGGTISF